MFTFKEFIVEVFDKPYSVTHDEDRDLGLGFTVHRYTVHPHDGKKFRVHISHDEDSGESEVEFSNHEGSMRVTGEERGKAARVIASVAKAVKHHVANTPTAKKVSFVGAKKLGEMGGRNRLYSRITAKAGGETKNDTYSTYHSIPVDKIKAA
jgi:hypothetical protein